MKGKIIFCWILICIALASNGQKLWEKVYSEREFGLSQFNSSSLVGDSMIVFSGTKTVWYCPGNFLSAISTSGEKIWSIKDQYIDHGDCGYLYCSGFFSQIAHLGESLYGVGKAVFGGIADEKVPISIFKWGLNGEKIFHKWYHNENWTPTYLFTPVHLDINVEEGLLVTGGESSDRSDRLIKFDLEGIVIWEKKFDSNITKSIFINDSNLAIISGTQLFICSSDGEISLQVDFEVGIADVIYHNNQIFVSEPEKVYIIDTETYQLTLTHTISLGEQINQIKAFNNEVWLLKQLNDSKIVSNLTSYEQVSYQFFMPNFGITDFYITKDEIIFLGTTEKWQMALLAFGRKETNPVITYPDIELVDIELSNTNLRLAGNPSFGDAPYIADYNARLTIRNNGSETIDIVGIFDSRPWIWVCGEHSLYQLPNELSLQPNQEMIVDLERSREYLYKDTLRICYQLMAPNSRLEANIKNNNMCKSFDFTNIPETPINALWSVYPNPSTSLITLTAPNASPFQFSIFSLEGKIMLEGANNEGIGRIDISDLPGGLYFIRLQQGDDISTVKLVRQ